MRLVFFRVAAYIGITFLGLGLYRTQVVKGEYYRLLSEQNRVRLIPLEAPRGRVFDRAGKLLATNRPSYDVIATPEDVTPEVFPRLASLLQMTEHEVRQGMSAPREYPFAPALIQKDIPKELAFVIEEHRTDLPGVSIRISSIRYYPYGETASHLIGYIGKINPGEYRQLDRQRYGFNSHIGRSGIEKYEDERLRGWRGGRQIEVNARGQLIRILSEKKPIHGEDIKVTIDLEFQQKITELIKDEHAVVGVLDLETEGMLALASSPAFDPNVFVSPGQNQERLDFLHDNEAPMLNRGVSSAYPPGSVFKLVTALAALETGKITPETRFHCSGSWRLKPGTRPRACWLKGGHGSLNLYEAIERSCNVYFYQVAARLSPDDIARYARTLGLGEPMKLEVTNITPGLVPDSAWKKQKYKEKWYQGETLSYALGQSYLMTSPSQILRLVAILAKDGRLVEPHLIETEKHKGISHDNVAIHEQNIRVIKRAMLRVVESDYGTGQLARVDFAKLAAKTGTAQVPPLEAHAWMTGFFPFEDPKIAFVVFVEHGGSGGIVAGGLAKQVLTLWRDYVSQVA